MKKNGFVQAVTQAINGDSEQYWSQDYWAGQRGDWANNRVGPFDETVTRGPEFHEFILMKEMTMSEGFRNQVVSPWW